LCGGTSRGIVDSVEQVTVPAAAERSRPPASPAVETTAEAAETATAETLSDYEAASIVGADPLGMPGATLPPTSVLLLQRLAGNTAVTDSIHRRAAQAGQRPGALGGPELGPVIQRDPPAAAAPTAAPAATAEQKQAFLNKCSEANTMIDLAQRTYSAWLSSISIAYGQAWRAHSDVLTSAKSKAQTADSIVLGAVLAFVPGGAGGLVGEMMKECEAGAFLIDGMKDLAKWGLRTGGAAAGPAAGPGFQAFPTDPGQWQNQANVRAMTELAVATKQVLDWQHAVNTNDANFDPSFDPTAAVDAALTIKGSAVKGLTPVDTESTRKGYQQGFMDDWITGTWPTELQNLDSVGWKKIEDKVDEYGNSIGMPGLGARLNAAAAEHLNQLMKDNDDDGPGYKSG
jgi:hypothetical protein